MKKKYCLVKQDELKDCGPACLATIIKYYGGNVPLDNLKEMCQTTKKGTTALEMVNTLKRIGFKAQGFKITLEEMNRLTFPCIAYVTINKSYNHYIVIYEINLDSNYVVVADPQTNIKKLTLSQFELIYNNICLTAVPFKKLPNIGQPTTSLFSYLKQTLKNYKKDVVLISLISFLTTFLLIILSYNFQYIINGIENSKPSNYFIWGLIIFGSLFVFKNGSDFLRNKLLINLNFKLDKTITNDIFSKIISLPYRYYKNRTTGEIMSKFNDLNKLKTLLSQLILLLFWIVPLSVLSLIVLWNINSNLCLIVFIIVLLYSWLILLFKPKYKYYINRLQEKKATINTIMVENISAFETIKGLKIEENIIKHFQTNYQSFLKTNKKFENYFNCHFLLKELIYTLGPLIIIVCGALMVLENQMTLGQLLTFNTLLTYFLLSLRNLIDLDTEISEAKNALRRVNSMLVVEDKKESDLKVLKGKIEIKNLKFAFRKSQKLFNKLSLTIPAGSKVMIVGRSGCGKSTLCQLLMQYYSVGNNQIYLDGIDINQYEDVREKLVYLERKSLLFTDTFYNNIVLNRSISDDEFKKATTICEIDYLLDNNLGYNTLIEENGFNLSGGEQQQILLARTLLKDFSILIIDEAISQMDIALERRILKKLFSNYPDKTIIVISHRYDNKDLFNQVITLKKGKAQEILERTEK